jgi:hypothetical protein
MISKRSLILLLVLFLEGMAVLLFSNLEKSWPAAHYGIGTATSLTITWILLAAFIVTLIPLLVSLFFVKGAVKSKSVDHKTTLSSLYLEESLFEGKSKKQILKDLEDDGYSKKEIGEFLQGWKKREQSRKSKTTRQKRFSKKF